MLETLPDTSRSDPRRPSNLEAIVRLEKESHEHRSRAERIGDAIAGFAGSERFILLHIIWFALWIVLNENLLPGLKTFDPYPFNFLTMVVSLEAILLTAFVMISQNRLSRQADRRAHLDLQINLLAEEELTKVLQILERICTRLNMHESDSEITRLMKKTDLASMADEIDRKLPD